MRLQIAPLVKKGSASMRDHIKQCGFCIVFLVTSAFAQNTFPASGNVGIGTTNPNAVLDVESSASVTVMQLGNLSAGGLAWRINSTSNGDGIGGGNFSIWQGGYHRLLINSGGNVGIGTVSPGAKLEINGNLKLTSGSGASVTFADGTIQSTAWTGSLCGGDYAESVDVTGERSHYEPGDVLVVDPDHPGHFLEATKPYSTLVAGIYSTKPGLVGRRQTTDPKSSKTEVPMAMVGIVPTKVSAENGPIKVGDLLVTSSMQGHAMKGTDRGLLTGAIVGKALGSLKSGTGVIEVLVSLQ